MRIDLLLQEAKLGVSHFPLIILDLVDHDFQICGHVVDGAGERTELVF